jgi:hypothetical protein
MSEEDINIAVREANVSDRLIGMAKSVLAQSVPNEFSYMTDCVIETPSLVYASMCNELQPGDSSTRQNLLDEIRDCDLRHHSGNVMKLSAEINAKHSRLKNMGERVTLATKISALIGSLRPAIEYESIIMQMENQQFKSFNHA